MITKLNIFEEIPFLWNSIPCKRKCFKSITVWCNNSRSTGAMMRFLEGFKEWYYFWFHEIVQISKDWSEKNETDVFAYSSWAIILIIINECPSVSCPVTSQKPHNQFWWYFAWCLGMFWGWFMESFMKFHSQTKDFYL